MFRRLLCLFCAALLLFSATPALAAKAPVIHSYDFDLTFSLVPEAFPRLARERAAGYAELLERLGLKGNLTWCPDTKSMDLDAVLYFTDKPSLSYPFRAYGTKSRLYITSPLLNNEDLFFDLAALLEFSAKAKNTLNIPMTYFAFLYPYVTEFAFKPLRTAWEEIIAPSLKTGTVTLGQFEELSAQWETAIHESPRMQRWIMQLMGIAETPEVVENEFNNLPMYYEKVTGGEPLLVTVDKHSEMWQDSAGNMLFSRQESEDSFSMLLSLPASANGYVPKLTYRSQADEHDVSFGLTASILRDPSFVASDEGDGFPWTDEGSFPYTEDGEYDEEYAEEEVVEEEYEEEASDEEVVEEEYEDGDGTASSAPDQLLFFRAVGSGLPKELPSDSLFTVSASILGTLYPDYTFLLQGSTKKSGAMTLSLCKPGDQEKAPTEFFRVTGMVTPAQAEQAPDYRKKSWKEAYNMFSINEQTLADFTRKMAPLVIKGFLSFVAEAPASACQALLDDLTDMGVIGMLMN